MTEETLAYRPTYTGARAIFASWGGLVVALFLLLLSAWRGYQALAGLSAALVALGLVIQLWGAASLRRLELTRRLERGHVFAGESVGYSLELTNNKAVPLPWVEVAVSLPVALAPGEPQPDPGLLADPNQEGSGEEPHRPRVSRVWRLAQASLLWYEKVPVEMSLPCPRRGIFRLGPAVVSSGDLFGLVVKARSSAETNRLVVYPAVHPIARLGLPSRFPMGASPAATPLFEDPSRTGGLRDYTPGTPFKRIHWKASARRQRLQVKVFEPTTTLRVGLFLDAAGFWQKGAEDPEGWELAISAAASLAAHLVAADQEVGLFANAGAEGGKLPVSLAPRGGDAHLAAILEGLAGLDSRARLSLERLWDQRLGEMFPGDTLVVLAAGATPAVVDRMLAGRRAGYQVAFAAIGGGALPGGGIPGWRVAAPGDLGGGPGVAGVAA